MVKYILFLLLLSSIIHVTFPTLFTSYILKWYLEISIINMIYTILNYRKFDIFTSILIWNLPMFGYIYSTVNLLSRLFLMPRNVLLGIRNMPRTYFSATNSINGEKINGSFLRSLDVDGLLNFQHNRSWWILWWNKLSKIKDFWSSK